MSDTSHAEMAPIDLDELTFIGTDLRRPESVVASSNGEIAVSDWRGGVTIIESTGAQRTLLGHDADWLRPNGIARCADGTFLLAHLGETDGGVFHLDLDGTVTPYCTHVDGISLPPTNFVVDDDAGRTWITVSTRRQPRAAGYRPDVADGFVVVVDSKRGARIVADGLGYTNEARVHPDGSHLYVNETFAKRLSRFAIRADGSLGARESVAEFGHGVFPDGLVFDEAGGAWVTSIISNRVIRVDPSGRHDLLIDDSDAAHVDAVERAFAAGSLGREHLDRAVSSKLRNISSLAFGGPDLRTVFLGCLLGDSIATFRSPIPGARPHNWSVTE